MTTLLHFFVSFSEMGCCAMRSESDKRRMSLAYSWTRLHEWKDTLQILIIVLRSQRRWPYKSWDSQAHTEDAEFSWFFLRIIPSTPVTDPFISLSFMPCKKIERCSAPIEVPPSESATYYTFYSIFDQLFVSNNSEFDDGTDGLQK
jgi:hypothetical protein